MNYSALYQASNKLHAGTPIEDVVNLLHQAGQIDEFDRVRLFHNVARQTGTSVESVADLYKTEPRTTGDPAKPRAHYRTHAEVIVALAEIEAASAEGYTTRARLLGVLDFLTEQERLANEAVDAAIESVSTGDGDTAETLLFDLVNAIDLISKLYLRKPMPDIIRMWLDEVAGPILLKARAVTE